RRGQEAPPERRRLDLRGLVTVAVPAGRDGDRRRSPAYDGVLGRLIVGRLLGPRRRGRGVGVLFPGLVGGNLGRLLLPAPHLPLPGCTATRPRVPALQRPLLGVAAGRLGGGGGPLAGGRSIVRYGLLCDVFLLSGGFTG